MRKISKSPGLVDFQGSKLMFHCLTPVGFFNCFTKASRLSVGRNGSSEGMKRSGQFMIR